MNTILKYTLLAGDQISTIATNFGRCKGLTLQDLTKANPTISATQLAVGQLLNIPDTSSSDTAFKYTVQSGDTFYLIATNVAKCAGVTSQHILDANPDIQPASLQIGQLINIPAASAPDIIAPITVKTQDGQQFTKQLDIQTTTLGDLKEIIEEQLNIPAALQTIGSATIAPFDGDTNALSTFQIGASGATLGVMSHGLPIQKGLAPEDYKIVLYYPSWAVYGRQFFLPAIDYSMTTHLNYAFADIKSNGTVYMPDNADAANFAALKNIKAKYPKLKTMLSIGGWSYSTNFSATAATATGRQTFVSSAIKLMKDNDFDGIDIDWEFPVEGGISGMSHNANDGSNFTLLLQDLRKALGTNALLTMTASPRPLYHQYLDIASIKTIVDWVNLMAYDYHGAWAGTENAVTNFNAPIYESTDDPTPVANKHDLNIDASVRSLLTLGLPAKQLVLGLSFYGRGYAGVEPGPDNNGLYQSYWKALPKGTWPDADNQDSGVYDWWDLSDNYLGKEDWQQYYHAQSQAAWLYSPSKKIFIAYDNPTSIWSKCAYIVAHGLGGAMAWDSSSDRYNQLLYVANYALRKDGIQASGGPIPDTTATGTAWSDEDVANDHSSPVSAINFAISAKGIIGLQTEYGSTKSDWRGSYKGRIIRMIIPAERYITQLAIETSTDAIPITGMRIRFDNGTSFTLGDSGTMTPQYVVGTCASFLFYLEGKATDENLMQLSCIFRSIPDKEAAPLYPLQNAPANSLALQVAEAKNNYLGKYTGAVSSEGLDSMKLASYDSPHFSFTAGSADGTFTASDQNGINYELGLQLSSVNAQLKIGNPDDPAVTIDYTGPTLGFDIHEEMTFSNGQAKVVLGDSLAGVDMSVGKNGFTMDSSFGDVSETVEIDKSHLKLGIDGDGFEINKDGLGIFFGIGPFSIHVHVLSIKALKSLVNDYIQAGIYLWKMAPVVFNDIAKGFGIVVDGIGKLFKSIFD